MSHPTTTPISKLFLTGLLAASLLAPAQASTTSEDFDYTAGDDLNGLNGGTNWGGAWNGSLTPEIQAGSLDFPSHPETGNKAILPNDDSTYTIFRSLPAPINESNASSATVSFLFNLTGNDDETGIRFAGLSLFDDGTELLFMGKPGNTTEIGFEKYAGGNVIDGEDDSFDSSTVFRFVAEITFDDAGDDLLDVTVTSNDGSVNETWSSLSLGSNFQFDRIRLIRDFALDSDIDAAFDEIKVETVPEPGSAASFSSASFLPPDPAGAAWPGLLDPFHQRCPSSPGFPLP